VVVFDGAYAAKSLVRPVLAEGATVVTRLHSDAKLFDAPTIKAGQRGWASQVRQKPNEFEEACRQTRRMDDDFLCLPRRHDPGTLQVVYGDQPRFRWQHPSGSSGTWKWQLGGARQQRCIEEHFHDVKEIWGVGQQQVRSVYSRLGCWHLCGWLYAMVELECWDAFAESLIDRSERPWDNPDRRPSHADRRRRIARKMLRESFSCDLQDHTDERKIRERFEQPLALAA
jgi:hypothetical protein